MPGIAESIEPLAQWLLGKPGYGLSWTMLDPSKTLQYNIAQTQRRVQLNSALYGALNQAQGAVTDNLMTNFYSLMGYSPEMARLAAEQGRGGLLHTAAEQFLIRPQISDAYYNIGNALYNRSVAWNGNTPYGQGNESAAYWSHGGELLQTVITNAANKVYGGMSVSDASVLAGQMIGVGALEEGGSFSKASQGERQARIRKFSRELRDYASSVNTLQDVIEGPVEQILESFEKLTGNKLVSMSVGRVDALSNAMRNVLMTGNISTQGVANLTAQQYGLIAPYGGNMTLASAMALSNAAALSYGHRIEGLSDIQLSGGLAQDNARMLLNGRLRMSAAAYTHWRRAHGYEDNQGTRERFFAQNINPEDYIRTNGVSGAELASVSTTNAMADPSFVAQARMGSVNTYRSLLDRMVGNLTVSDDRRERIGKILNSTFDIGRMEEMLVKEGLVSQAEAAEIGRAVGVIGRTAAGNSDTATAMGMLATTEGGASITMRTQGGSLFRKLQGIKGGVDGFAGIVNAFTGEDKLGTGWDVGRMIASFMGLNFQESVASAEKFANEWEKATDKTQLLREQFAKAGFDEASIKSALKLGSSGISILTGKGDKAKKQEVLRRLGTGNMSREDLRGYAEEFGWDAATIDKAYLQGGAQGRDITDAEVKQFQEAREWVDTSLTGEDNEIIDGEDRDKRARALMQAKNAAQAARLMLSKGGKYVTREELRKELQTGTSDAAKQFQNAVKTVWGGEGYGEIDRDSIINQVTKQDGLIGLLESILEAIQKLKT